MDRWSVSVWMGVPREMQDEGGWIRIGGVLECGWV